MVMVQIAEGRGNNLGKARNKTLSWRQFVNKMNNPSRSGERFRDFLRMTKDQQDELKSVDGWLLAAPITAGKRNRESVMPRTLLSLDYDYATPEFVSMIELGLCGLSDYEFFVHSTRRHTDEKPRLRLFAPLARPVSVDEFAALSRIVAMMMENTNPMQLVDKVSFRPAQMMFLPTASKDGDWFSSLNRGKLLNPDKIFADFEKQFGDYSDHNNLPLCADEQDLRKVAEKAEDPTTKKGPVGDFCRAYDVPAAIEKFIPDCYEPVDDYSAKPRYSYLKGTSTSGAVVEDDGLFLYSHHGSDPCADMLVNAFDLVRIHLFGELDEDIEKGTPPTRWPSYKRMLEFLADDAEYRASQAASRYDISAMFEDVDDDGEEYDEPGETEETDPFDEIEDEEDDADASALLGFDDVEVDAEPVTPKKRKPKPPTDWFPDQLTMDKDGKLESTAPNAAVIVHNDARMFGAIAYNDFSKQIVARRSIKSRLDVSPPFICRDKINGDRWQDINDISIRLILESANGEGKVGYGMRITDRDLNAAIISAAHRNRFHPVREYFEACAERWDGRKRIETLLIRYLGVEDDAYHREIIYWMMIASVARIMEPGCKFDYAIILQGEQGIRKSSFIKALYGEEWFAELDCKLDDKQQIAETIAGKMVLELPELSGFHKSDHNAAKAFMRRQFDDVRMAYDRRTSEFPRQCVFWGTTNDKKYLKDPTGGRSYWPVIINQQLIDTDGVAAERDQLWAEAVNEYRALRQKRPKGGLELTLHSKEARERAATLQHAARSEELHEMWAERIDAWLEEPVTLRQLMIEFDTPIDDAFDEEANGEKMVIRTAFTREQAVAFALKRDHGIMDYQTAQNIERALPMLTGWSHSEDTDKKHSRIRVNGQRRRWWVRAGASAAEISQGFAFVPVDDDESDDYSHRLI